MSWRDNLKGDSTPWLLEEDNPSVRYLTLTRLLDRPEDDPEVRQARASIMASEPVRTILANQAPEGYWAKSGWGYAPKYQGTVWQITFLGLLGADGANERVRRGCEYFFEHARSFDGGGFSALANHSPAGAIQCMKGNLIFALLHLGYRGDPRLDVALDWLARSATGHEFESRYHRYYKVAGPGFLCSANNGQPCAWGAVKVLLALGAVPAAQRTEAVQEAIAATAEFLLSHDLARADYPTGWGTKPSSVWFKFGFPLGYISDVLEAALALGEAGYGGDPRLGEVRRLVLSKQDGRGRWRLENTLNGKMWADIEVKRQPSKWIT